jgi:hypothetical protein
VARCSTCRHRGSSVVASSALVGLCHGAYDTRKRTHTPLQTRTHSHLAFARLVALASSAFLLTIATLALLAFLCVIA